MKKYKVMIKGLGVKSVKAKDIDGAYINACKQHGCKIDDILVVMCEDPFKPGERLSGKCQPVSNSQYNIFSACY